MAMASLELNKRRGEDLKINVKPDASLVTEADLASERVIIERISKYYPGDLIYAEESGMSSKTKRHGSAVWVVDPLDGTTNYANGYPYYCISIGRGIFDVNEHIQMQCGAVFDPVRGKFYYAEAGKGAYCDGRRLQVTAAREFCKSFLVTGFYYLQGPDLQHEIARFSKIAAECQSIRRDGAAALDLALVAEGVFDAFWELGLAPWDVAAGSLLVREAGGIVRNYPPHHGSYNIEGVGVIAGTQGAVETLTKHLC
ncbi:MAG: inositol monophosphatase [Deltaproteobacteria bacterium]|nr:inositol monophosphatase [Deltaproteobacteria bacterium]